jgi:hypothetical protein
MCEHLQVLEAELKRRGIVEHYRGKTWTANCHEFVYFDCYFDFASVQKRLQLPDCIQHHVNDDERSGLEDGFYCSRCHDAIVGLHPRSGVAGKITIT